MAGLAARGSPDMRYTLLMDSPPEWPVPEGLDVVVAKAGQTMAQTSSGKRSRSLADLFSRAGNARRLNCDLLFYPASYSYFPALSRIPTVVCIHDTIPERFPDLVFPTRRNFLFWQAKTWLAKGSSRAA